MPDINQVYSGDRLKADDLKKPDGTYAKVQGVVERVDVVELPAGRDGDSSAMTKKLEVHLVGKDKSLIVNKTNAQNIAMSAGPVTENWTGITLGISVHMTPLGPGLKVEVIALRPAAGTLAGQVQAEPVSAVGIDEVLPVGEPGYDESDIPF